MSLDQLNKVHVRLNKKVIFAFVLDTVVALHLRAAEATTAVATNIALCGRVADSGRTLDGHTSIAIKLVGQVRPATC